MNYEKKIKLILNFRKKLKRKKPIIGGWMQLCNSDVAEILCQKQYDTITLDFEHGSFDLNKLNEIFRVIEMHNKIPLVRLANHDVKDLGQIFDSGCSGVIIPNVKKSKDLEKIIKHSCWPPRGKRGVGFSRSNMYGRFFNKHKDTAQKPILIAMIEDISALKNLDKILSVKNLDSVLIGPYDLSASLGKPGKFNNKDFKTAIKTIKNKCKIKKIPIGMHIVEPSKKILKQKIKEGYQFIPFSLDTVLLNKSLDNSFGD